jgi:hypothetical protein
MLLICAANVAYRVYLLIFLNNRNLYNIFLTVDGDVNRVQNTGLLWTREALTTAGILAPTAVSAGAG